VTLGAIQRRRKNTESTDHQAHHQVVKRKNLKRESERAHHLALAHDQAIEILKIQIFFKSISNNYHS
jgi:hypothetical protein